MAQMQMNFKNKPNVWILSKSSMPKRKPDNVKWIWSWNAEGKEKRKKSERKLRTKKLKEQKLSKRSIKGSRTDKQVSTIWLREQKELQALKIDSIMIEKTDLQKNRNFLSTTKCNKS
jgi:hypothetical protein